MLSGETVLSIVAQIIFHSWLSVELQYRKYGTRKK